VASPSDDSASPSTGSGLTSARTPLKPGTTGGAQPADAPRRTPSKLFAGMKGVNDDLTGGLVDFDAVNKAARPRLLAVLRRMLPEGAPQGAEFVARNPLRTDRRPGSFKINLRTGRWADFATDAKGGDVISLVAYLHQLPQSEAARRLAHLLGLDTSGRAS
jgi:hypothetical protein